MRPRVLVLVLFACHDPSVDPSNLVHDVAGPGELEVEVSPVRAEGHVARVTRIALHFPGPIDTDATSSGHLVLVEGGASNDDVDAIARGNPLAALRARLAPVVTFRTREAPDAVFVQPTRALAVGRLTLIARIDRKPPFVAELVVDDDAPIAWRVWPVRVAGKSDPWIYCTTALPDLLPTTTTLAPSGVVAEVRARDDAPCIELRATSPLSSATSLPPPSIGELLLDPTPIVVTDVGEPALGDAHCPTNALALGPVCARLEDDRLILLGRDEGPVMALGAIGDSTMYAGIPLGARRVVRGLKPGTPFTIDLRLRDGGGESTFTTTLTTAPRRVHLVINEVYAKPSSGIATQRFVELANDGETPVPLSGLALLDGDVRIALDPLGPTIPPGGFLLVTTSSFVDGLAGEIAPPADTPRLHVDQLSLRTELTLDEGADTISRFPATTSTRKVSRGRRLPETPDDAADAFGFDAHGKSTPGAPNVLE